jgi:hypothetical protein
VAAAVNSAHRLQPAPPDSDESQPIDTSQEETDTSSYEGNQPVNAKGSSQEQGADSAGSSSSSQEITKEATKAAPEEGESSSSSSSKEATKVAPEEGGSSGSSGGETGGQTMDFMSS